jgi:hypothetical protein
MLNFAGVKEAENFTTFKEGYVAVKITKATEGVNDDGIPIWAFEYTVQNGQYKGEVIKDTVYLANKDNDEKKTKTLLSKIKRMYSRILGVQLDGSRNCTPTEFLNANCTLKLVQKPSTKEGKTSYFTNIEFAGFFATADYVVTMDDEMAHSEAYLKHMENQEGGGGTASAAATSKKVAGF